MWMNCEFRLTTISGQIQRQSSSSLLEEYSIEVVKNDPDVMYFMSTDEDINNLLESDKDESVLCTVFEL